MIIPREERTTLFIGNEGESEKVFSGHLASLYARGKIAVRYKVAGGKDPVYIVNKSNEQRGGFEFCHAIILIDTDKDLSKARRLACKLRFELIESTPCLEGFLLCILSDEVPRASDDCKKKFHQKYNGSKRVLTEKCCKDHLTKECLELARKRIPHLDRLLNIFEGNFGRQ